MSGSTAKGYLVDLRERSVRMLSEVRDDHESDWRAATQVTMLPGVGTPLLIGYRCGASDLVHA